jgi:hypothetical protein
MRNLLLTAIVLLELAATSYSQEKATDLKKWSIGLGFHSIGQDYISQIGLLDGEPHYSGSFFYAVGLNCFLSLNDRQKLETGIEYGFYKINVKPYLGPSYTEYIYLIDIPINLRTNKGKYIFITGGPLLDIDLGNPNLFDNQTGIGANIGVGFNYFFSNGLAITFNPYFKAHSVIPFSFKWLNNRLFEAACKFGIILNL